MPTRRTIRLSALVQAELGRLAAREKTLEGELLTFTSVDVAPDLHNAYVYFSSLSHHLHEEELMKKLSRLAPQWQREIGSRLKIKYTPRLNFRYSKHIERGDRVMGILNELGEVKPAPTEPEEQSE